MFVEAWSSGIVSDYGSEGLVLESRQHQVGLDVFHNLHKYEYSGQPSRILVFSHCKINRFINL